MLDVRLVSVHYQIFGANQLHNRMIDLHHVFSMEANEFIPKLIQLVNHSNVKITPKLSDHEVKISLKLIHEISTPETVIFLC